MVASIDGMRRLLALAAVLLGVALLRAQEETAPFPRPGDYVGVAECTRCHEGQQRKLAGSAHAAILDSAALPGCETCHGPGATHARDDDNALEAVTMPPKLTLAAQTAFCARCHQDQIEHHGGDLAGLQQANKACTDCHEVHVRRRPVAAPAFRTRAEAARLAEPIGSAACVDCHPLRDARLSQSAHAALSAHARADGCETCHGNGSEHARSSGTARTIVRPDRADDGAATCAGCHREVDVREFHWRNKAKPYLAESVTCATCHRVHVAKDAAAAPAAAAEPASNRLCAQCHAPALCTMPGSTHASLGGPDTPLERGCASCHRGGEAHARSGGKKAPLQQLGGRDPAVQARVCLDCHQKSEALRGAEHGVHQRRGVGCVDCHGPLHGADPTKVAVSAEQNCRRCHPAVAAEFALPNHHPVPEGRMRCSSCHDVHNDRPRVRDLQLAEQRCVTCHPQSGGPFVFAHQAGRREGCVACHVPHGSSNRRLLQQPTSQQNCLSCHGDFPVFHDQTSGAVFTDCLRCHTEVHGSNHARFLFR